MAPKKKQQKPQNPRPKPSSSTGGGVARLQISSENERRLRRLLANNSAATAPAPAAAVGTGGKETRERKAKRLRAVYDKLAEEGFRDQHIEMALVALNETATFEAALDWLCFNLSSDELPMKYSSGATSSSHQRMSGSVKVVSTARDDWVPQQQEPSEWVENKEGMSVVVRGGREEVSLDDEKSSQAAWIRQYMERQDEEDNEYFDNSEQKDLRSQISHGPPMLDGTEDLNNLFEEVEECEPSSNEKNKSEEDRVMESDAIISKPSDSSNNGTSANEIEEDEIELDNLFSDDPSNFRDVPQEVLKLQKPKKPTREGYGNLLRNLDDIWKKGDVGKLPKAVLQKLCQRLGWEAPKYTKVYEKDSKYNYAVDVLRGTTGRGKSRKAGGLSTIQLPEGNEASSSVEDAQNKVATLALYQLFPDLPLSNLLMEPYSLLVLKWEDDEYPSEVIKSEDHRRSGFVDMLLNTDDVNKDNAFNKKLDSAKENYIELSNRAAKFSQVRSDNLPRGLASPEEVESILLKQQLENKRSLPNYVKMMTTRNALPIAKLKDQFLQLLKDNDVVVICGETGCGKTTQIPQFILDEMIESGFGGYCNIVCTQPRRIAAISVAERVSNERCDPLPGSEGSLVGYQVRLDSARNEKTRILFCTTGILLRKLAGDKDLAGTTHVVVDEVHERSLLGDFLLIVLKNLIEKQISQGGPRLKVILMSATVDATLFSKYFGGCPVLTAEGRTYPVSSYYLEDIYENIDYTLHSDSVASGSSMTRNKGKWHNASHSIDNHRGKKNLVLSSWGDDTILYEDFVNPHYFPQNYGSYSEKTRQNLKHLNEDVIDFDLLEELICHIDENYQSGAILVFLPGVPEIDALVDRLTASLRFGGESSDWVLPLHSLLTPADQKKVFQSPPQNIRKIIVATDIAETSITIDDVIYVIDSGKHKENRYNPQKKMSSIVEDWISRANAKQRRGRAGRVREGMCFCLYTLHRFETLMRPFQVPEMLRMPLTDLCLHIKSLSLGDIKSFLMKAIEPPRDEVISSAIDLLYKVGAFEGDEELSPLGLHLSKLPVDVLIGKILLYGAIFGCLSPVLSVAAFLSYKSPFISPKDEKQNVERAKATLLNEAQDATAAPGDKKQSDHLLMVIAYQKWAGILREDGARAAHQFCRSFYLNSSVMYMVRDMRIQFGNLLADIGLVSPPKDISLSQSSRKNNLEDWFSDMSLPFNMYSNYSSIIKSVICAGLYPNVAATLHGINEGVLGVRKASDFLATKNRPCWFDGRREVFLHPSSVNHSLKLPSYPFLVYLEKVETTKVFLRDTSIISPYSLLLFGGSIVVQHQSGSVVIDGWLKLNASAQIAVLFKQLRATFDSVLRELAKKPEKANFVHNDVVKSIIHLLLEEEKVE